jgi:hypothetical protein
MGNYVPEWIFFSRRPYNCDRSTFSFTSFLGQFENKSSNNASISFEMSAHMFIWLSVRRSVRL